MKVFKSLHEESNKGWIWITPVRGIKSRQIIHVKNKMNNKSMYYRDILEINYNDDISYIVIKKINSFQVHKWLQFLTKHPDISLQLAAKLAIISILIGKISIFISMF